MYSSDTAPWDRGADLLRTMRIDSFTPTKGLRSNNVDRCRYCNHLVEYYDRVDGGRIPLVPREFPSASVPLRCRWHVNGGVASVGDRGRAYCYIAHPTLCPGVQHEDADDPQLADARRAMAVRTQRAISRGLFAAPLRITEDEVTFVPVEAETERGIRHVLTYSSVLWIGPAEIDRVRCVAHVSTSRERCKKTVFDDGSFQGSWEQVEIPVPAGRAAQESLWAGQMMWAFSINGLDYHGYRRWLSQRCTVHWEGTAHDAVAPQWERFSIFRDEGHIIYERPAQADSQDAPAAAPVPVCASDGCTHTTVRTVEEGWLCWQCERKQKRRRRTHKRWTWAEEDKLRGFEDRPLEGEGLSWR
ncbi:DUF6083 domain-containing protein (plasmid) [Streptomyces sp. DSM 116496]|uniref:DUF6083 domain-containing protein n=1 Tax=Streptomyces stoeckheimensis TaxID=3344656 RepID=UPI0038B34EC2